MSTPEVDLRLSAIHLGSTSNILGSDLNDHYRIFHHLLHHCTGQDWEDVANILEERFDIHGLPDGDHLGRITEQSTTAGTTL